MLPVRQVAPVPEKQAGFWKLAGPGAVLVGLSIGAGEIIVWPRIVAEYGAGVVWAAGAGLFLQLWINFEVGRWTLATGESVYTGFSRIWRGFAGIFILLNVLAWLAPGWGRASGLALKALCVGPQGFGSDTFWTAVTFAAVALLLFGPKLAYKSVERTISALVILVTAGLCVVAVQVGKPQQWSDLLWGMVNVPYKPPGMTVKALFIAIVFAGAGGTANLFYTFYLREKGHGMGALLKPMANPLRGGASEAPVGFTFESTPENCSRFRAWFNHMRTDQMIFFFDLNTLTIVLFIFASLAVLRPSGIVPEQGTLIWDEALILEKIWGLPGRNLFLLVGVATLFSTQLTIVDGVSRSVADIVHTNFHWAQQRGLGYWYILVAGLWIVFGCVITFVMESRNVSELGFLFNAAYMGGYAMAIYTPLLLLMNHRLLPEGARSGPVHTFFMIVASFVYGGFAIACSLWEFGLLPEM